MPGCDTDISLKGDGDLSDGEFYQRMGDILSDTPWWFRLVVVSGFLLLMVIGAVITLPLAIIDYIRDLF